MPSKPFEYEGGEEENEEDHRIELQVHDQQPPPQRVGPFLGDLLGMPAYIHTPQI